MRGYGARQNLLLYVFVDLTVFNPQKFSYHSYWHFDLTDQLRVRSIDRIPEYEQFYAKVLCCKSLVP